MQHCQVQLQCTVWYKGPGHSCNALCGTKDQDEVAMYHVVQRMQLQYLVAYKLMKC